MGKAVNYKVADETVMVVWVRSSIHTAEPINMAARGVQTIEQHLFLRELELAIRTQWCGYAGTSDVKLPFKQTTGRAD